MRRACIIGVLCLCGLTVRAQMRFEAGTSTLFNSTGASWTLFQNDRTYSVGAAYSEGHVAVGAYETFPFHDYLITAGSQSVGYSTQAGGVGFPCICVAATQRIKPGGLQHWHVGAFAGMVGNATSSPWSVTAKPSKLGGGFVAEYKTPRIDLSTLDSISADGRRTLVQGASYRRDHIQLIASGGLISSQRFLNAGAMYSTNSFSASAQHYTAFYPTVVTVNTASVSDRVSIVTLSGSANKSDTALLSTTGGNASASVDLHRVAMSAGYYESQNRLGKMVMEYYNFNERLTRRISVNESISDSNGHRSVAFGGGYSGNRFQVNVSHSMQFLVTGYQQVLSVSLSVRIHDTQLQAQTVTLPTGQTKWTTGQTTYVQKTLATASHEGGKYTMEGDCVDEDEKPVEGCAIQLTLGKVKDVTYTNAHGKFQYRTKLKEITVVVLPEEFTGGDFTVLAAPIKVTQGVPAKIKVRKM